MITCGKCGFSQPKDVYCANCGINLQKYKPQKAPLFIRLLKDPYIQVGAAVVVAFLSFTFYVNIPSTSTESLSSEPTQQANKDEVKLATSEESPISIGDQRTALIGKKIEITARPALKKVAAKKVNDGSGDEEGSFANGSTSSENLDAEPSEAPELPTNKQSTLDGYRLSVAFYEMNTAQAPALFTGSKSVSLKIVKKSAVQLSGSAFFKTEFEKSSELSDSKKIKMDYTLEAIEEDVKNGLMISYLSQKNLNSPNRAKFTLSVYAQIPLSSNTRSSIDWERTIFIEKDDIALVRINLPRKDVPDQFLESVYGSPLGILTSPGFLDGKTNLVLAIQLL